MNYYLISEYSINHENIFMVVDYARNENRSKIIGHIIYFTFLSNNIFSCGINARFIFLFFHDIFTHMQKKLVLGLIFNILVMAT